MTGFVSRRARWILAATVLFTAVSFALGGTVVSRLKSGASLFQDPRSESVRAFDLLQNASGLEPDPGVVALVRHGDVAAVRARIARDPEVARTTVSGHFVFGFFYHGLDVRSQQAATRLRSAFAGDHDVVLGGGPIANQQINATVRSDLERAERSRCRSSSCCRCSSSAAWSRRSCRRSSGRSPSAARCSGYGPSWRSPTYPCSRST